MGKNKSDYGGHLMKGLPSMSLKTMNNSKTFIKTTMNKINNILMKEINRGF